MLGRMNESEPQSLITDALRARVGVPTEPRDVTVTAETVQRLREALTNDPDAPDDGRVPPAAVMVLESMRATAPLPDLPGSSLVTGDEWELRRPLRVGEPLRVVSRLADVNERLGGRLGHALFVRHEWEIDAADGQPVAFARRSMAYYHGAGRRPAEPPPPAEMMPPPPSAEDLPPGVDPWTAREGDPIAMRVLRPARSQVARFSALTWGFTPIFFDDDAARAAGLPGTIIPGPLKLALLSEAVMAWAGPNALLETIRIAHRRPDLPGRTLVFGGTVTRVEDLPDGRRVECELWIRQDTGDRSAVGAATVRLTR
jgi:acyl dehydratase